MLQILKEKLYAGAKWSWTESIPGYPATSYSLKVLLKYQTNTTITINASASGEDFLCEKISSETSSLPNGDYAFQVFLTDLADNENVKLYEEGIVHIYPNLATATDSRDYWMQVVENLRDAYKKLTSREMKEVIVNGKRVLYEDRTQLLKEIHNAEIKAGIRPPTKKIYARFN